MFDVILDTVIDTLKLLPFLFLTYLLMEFLEHKAGDKAEAIIKKSGRFGPILGAFLGVFPQCGFSAAASGLYSGGIITVGTLIAIFLSTSDEMLPILLSHRVPALSILVILGIKVLIAVVAGLAVDLAVRLVIRKGKDDGLHIVDICEEEHCHCEKGIFHSALHHTVSIALFVLIITFALNTAIYFIGEDRLASLFVGIPLVGSLAAALIGLIPNCAASVAITELYLNGIISFGAMMSGLLVGAGVGILILFRTNHKPKDNIAITATLYLIGALSGILIDIIGITAVI